MCRMVGFAEKLNIQNCENSMGNCLHYICTEGLNLQKNWISRTAKIHWDLLKNWISRTAKIQREIVYIIYVRNGCICRKIEYPKLRKFGGKFCMLYMYGMSGFADKLNIQNCENSTGHCLHNICSERLCFLKNWISRTAKIQREIVYIIYVRNGCIWRKIEYPELRKFNGKLCTLFMYRMTGFVEKLNIRRVENSMGNCVHYIHTECLDLPKNWISRTVKIQQEIVSIIYVQNVWISYKIEYPKLRKFNGKLCTLYMYKMAGFEEKLNIQSYKNSTANCVCYVCTECLD